MTTSLLKFFNRFLPNYKVHIVVRGKTLDGAGFKVTIPYTDDFDKMDKDDIRELYAMIYWQLWDDSRREVQISTLFIEDVVRIK